MERPTVQIHFLCEWASEGQSLYKCTYCTILWIKPVLHVIRRLGKSSFAELHDGNSNIHLLSGGPHGFDAILVITMQLCTLMFKYPAELTRGSSWYLSAPVFLSAPCRDPIFYVDDSCQDVVDPAFPGVSLSLYGGWGAPIQQISFPQSAPLKKNNQAGFSVLTNTK